MNLLLLDLSALVRERKYTFHAFNTQKINIKATISLFALMCEPKQPVEHGSIVNVT